MRARAAAEPERGDGQHGDVGVDVVAAVAGGFDLAGQGLGEDHPEGVAGGDTMARLPKIPSAASNVRAWQGIVTG